MTSLSRQLDLHEASRRATSSLEASSRAAIGTIFDAWDAGELTNVSVRYRLESVVRSSYRTSASVARSVAVSSAELPGWEPAVTFRTDYLESLLDDVRRNLRAYKAGTMSRAQAIFRIEHSAGVGAQRGYTDQIVSAYNEMAEFGYKVKKYWVANFKDGNVPCPSCRKLHGTSVPLNESFKVEAGGPGIYRDLIGPPRHPRCKCRLFLYVTSLENLMEEPDFEAPEDTPMMMSAASVRSLPVRVFASVKASLAAFMAFLKR